LCDYRVEAFRFSSPVVSARHDPLDGGRKEFLRLTRFLLHCTQLLDLNAQYVYLDKQQFEFPPHHW